MAAVLAFQNKNITRLHGYTARNKNINLPKFYKKLGAHIVSSRIQSRSRKNNDSNNQQEHMKVELNMELIDGLTTILQEDDFFKILPTITKRTDKK